MKGETTSQVIITYGVKDATLKITDITGQTVVAGDHSLITYPESYSNPSGSSYPNTDGVVLANVVVDGSGNITGYNQVVTNPGTFENMKIWLVPNTDLFSGSAKLNAWNQPNYMFETGLTDYYKSSGL